MDVLCYNGLNLQRVCIGKNVNRHFSQNFGIFVIKITDLNDLLSFLLSYCFSARSEAFQTSYRFLSFNNKPRGSLGLVTDMTKKKTTMAAR